MRVARLALPPLNFKSSSSAGSSALLARLKSTSGLTISVMHVKRDRIYFLVSFVGQRSAALCRPHSVELMCLSNPTAWACFVFYHVCPPSCVSWQCCWMERCGGHFCMAVGVRDGGGSTLGESWQVL